MSTGENHQFELIDTNRVAPTAANDPERESVALLGLSSVDGMAYQRLYDIQRSGLTFSEVVEQKSAELLIELFRARSIRIPRNLCTDIARDRKQILDRGAQQLKFLKNRGVGIVHRFEQPYPHQLNDLEHPPGWLFFEGNPNILGEPAVSIVGTRKPSEDGIFLGTFLLYLLHGTNITTVSGLASGIDKLVHEKSIEVGLSTIAVLGNGIHQNYPHDSARLRRSIVENGGCIVSEYLPNEKPNRKSFVWRNRIQAALGRATIPVEWKVKSGTAHTVRYALEMDRAVVGLKLPNRESREIEFVNTVNGHTFSIPSQSDDLLCFLSRVLE